MLLRASLVSWLTLIGPAGAEWRADVVPTPGRVTSIEVLGTETQIGIGSNWYRIASKTRRLLPSPAPVYSAVPLDGLPDGRVAISRGTIARVGSPIRPTVTAMESSAMLPRPEA